MGKTVKTKKKKWFEFLGPVENLESYVKADWWRHIFNANYLRTDGDVVEDETITRNEVDIFLSILAPSKESAILDLCCGQGRHSLELARQGFTNITGLDRSHYLITRARKLNNREDTNITFKEGDARKLPFAPDTFDFVIILGNSFGYFESLKDDLNVLKNVMRTLKPFGRLLIDLTDGEWIDKNYFVCRERSLTENDERLISREVITHVKRGVIADQFYAERLYTQEDLSDLLKSVNFENITFHSEITPDSKRNQDLGMMEKRIIVSAICKKEWTTVRKKEKATKNILVLMGDPGKSDVVRPNANFDDDDFVTINELKKALAELNEYHFVYLYQHNALINKLLQMKHKAKLIMFSICVMKVIIMNRQRSFTSPLFWKCLICLIQGEPHNVLLIVLINRLFEELLLKWIFLYLKPSLLSLKILHLLNFLFNFLLLLSRTLGIPVLASRKIMSVLILKHWETRF